MLRWALSRWKYSQIRETHGFEAQGGSCTATVCTSMVPTAEPFLSATWGLLDEIVDIGHAQFRVMLRNGVGSGKSGWTAEGMRNVADMVLGR
ncbi:hypothetical protein TOPH_07923 [Tolypocladium ophioglossoides CBS 100239]|uniref:Uncharacterized protein n=1 Tax=Tolypocladium ophioglossoides (strain CBS 100239) TaxID=1163406 RepID=A0A0L0N0U5_TOLOC|nr:hypothetical protein TOPH_07923 [Tolypocladium ophioglossoides CBS 100239]